MRILFWADHFWPYVGGPEILSAKLLPALRTRGHEFTVVTSQHYLDLPAKSVYQDIPISRFPFNTALANRDIDLLINAQQDVMQLKKACAPELIHLNGVGASAVYSLAATDLQRVPLIVTLHTLHGALGAVRSDGRETLFQKILSSASWISCVSKAVLDDARKHCPGITGRSSVIYNGLQTSNRSPTALRFDAPRVLCLGRLIPAKGFDLAVSAFATLIERFSNATLVVAGDGPVRSTLKAQVASLGIGSSVEFTGWVPPDQVPDLINDATMVLMPSRREGLPLVGIEAAHMGRPVIGTRVGGLPEIILHEKTGLLVEREDVIALTHAIAALLDQPDRARQMGIAAQARAREVFALEHCVQEYDDLYRSVGQKSSYAGCA
jgi:glycogen(starch) synthase